MKDLLFAKCLFYVFKSLGIAPITFKKNSSWFCRSSYGLIYNTILMSVILAINIYAVKLTLEDHTLVLFDRIVDCTHKGISALASLYIVLTFCIHQDKATRIANKLNVLYQVSTRHAKSSSTKVFKTTCLVSLVAWLPLVPVGLHTALPSFALRIANSYICDAIITGTMLEYSLLLILAKLLFECVNDNFDKITSTPMIHCIYVKSVKSVEVSNLREMHLSVCDVCEKLEQFYSAAMLSCSFYTFVTLILYAYGLLAHILYEEKHFETWEMIYYVVRLVHGLAALCILTNSVSAVIDESKRTGKIVNKLIWISTDDQETMKLSKFSDYLLHQNLRFSAAGLFPLDGTLMMSIIASITTYLVILIDIQD